MQSTQELAENDLDRRLRARAVIVKPHTRSTGHFQTPAAAEHVGLNGCIAYAVMIGASSNPLPYPVGLYIRTDPEGHLTARTPAESTSKHSRFLIHW